MLMNQKLSSFEFLFLFHVCLTFDNLYNSRNGPDKYWYYGCYIEALGEGGKYILYKNI